MRRKMEKLEWINAYQNDNPPNPDHYKIYIEKNMSNRRTEKIWFCESCDRGNMNVKQLSTHINRSNCKNFYLKKYKSSEFFPWKIITCSRCGKLKKWNKYQNICHYCATTSEDFKKKLSDIMHKPEINRQISRAIKENWTPKQRKKMSNRMFELWRDGTEYSDKMRELRKSDDYRKKISEGRRRQNNEKIISSWMKRIKPKNVNELESVGIIELTEFCRKYFDKIIESDKEILDRLEIDILIPETNLGIEYCQFKWHTEKTGINKKYHLYKTSNCLEKGIRLIHIFEDEWLNKKDIVKSILLSKFGKISNKIFARKCEISKLDDKTARNFYENNHIQGYLHGLHLGLIFEGNIVIMMTFGKSRFNKNYQWEVLRLCTRKNTQVLGGMSKLFNHFIQIKDPDSVVTYVDARYGQGKSYISCGFKYLKHSSPNYYYIKINSSLRKENRLKYQKHKLSKLLEKYDPNLSEWENMQLNGFDRIWDCGNYIYEWRKGG